MTPTMQGLLIADRLIVRRFRVEDADAARVYMTDPGVMQFMGDGVLDAAQVTAFIAANLGDDARAYALERRADGQVIGHLVFHPWYAVHTYEIGWVLAPAFQGQGYATEAARALLQYGFTTLGVHRVIATCQPENPASWRVMEKLGMRREAHFVQGLHRGGDVWWDEYFYAILRREWQE